MALVVSSCDSYFSAVGTIAESPVLASKAPKPTASQSLEPSPSETVQPTEAPSESETPTPTLDPSLVFSVNPLTGKGEYMHEYSLTTKPVAIIVENQRVSLPQLGMSQADIIIEMLVESDISRFLVIFQDPYNVEEIGAVRSLRSYFTKMACAFDSYIFHYGFSENELENAKQDLINRGMTTVNGLYGEDNGLPFWRDSARRALGIDSVHCVVTAGNNILTSMKNLPLSKTQKTNEKLTFNFSTKSSTESGELASKVNLSGIYLSSPYFMYDEERGQYLRYQFSDAQVDGNTGEQLACENLFVLRMDTEPLYDAPLHVAITTYGKGTGYYFNDGKYVSIEWTRDTDSSAFVFTHNGEELKVAIGNSWICCVPINSNVGIR